MTKKKIIIVTDGDRTAKAAVEKAASAVGGRTISASGGNPTPISGEELAQLILSAPKEPVLVMVDDCGKRIKGPGEKVLEELAHDERMEILGVIAVASNTSKVEGVPVDFSITRERKILRRPVDKEGVPEVEGHYKVEGDTVDVLNRLDVPVVIGLGDIGKMDEADRLEDGALVTTQAVQEILKYHHIM